MLRERGEENVFLELSIPATEISATEICVERNKSSTYM